MEKCRLEGMSCAAMTVTSPVYKAVSWERPGPEQPLAYLYYLSDFHGWELPQRSKLFASTLHPKLMLAGTVGTPVERSICPYENENVYAKSCKRLYQE